MGAIKVNGRNCCLNPQRGFSFWKINTVMLPMWRIFNQGDK